MKLSEILYDSAKEIWNSYYDHPFVKGIGTGELNIEKFRYYMIQDYLYLLEYAKIFALGVIKAKDEDTMRAFAELVNSTLNSETNIHKDYMARLNISKEEVASAKPALANASYTNYMLWVSQNEGLLQLAVTVLSCSWSYKMIADKLSKIPGATEHEFYGQWIRGYISPEYNKTNDNAINLVNKLGENCSKDEIENLKDIFINCSRFEYMFWDMAYNLSK